ncbi:alpha/beta hydrolase [Ensifer soli]|uniref:alpha/beta hydrolase n=1 Tax=Ciceribacter sp. sgz301302 TaxID=3342379 RepID=UPI0035B92812
MVALDPGARRVLDLQRAAGGKPFEEGTVDAARGAYNAGGPTLQGERVGVASVHDRVVDGPAGPIRVRVYRGLGAPEHDAPALVYYHGGGWVIGSLDSHDEICRWFANAAACVVVCPDYRLAPEHKFPAPVEDCRATLAAVVARASEFGIDPARVAVAGDSAGGNLAAVVALMARDGDAPKVTAQLLIYPNTDAAQTADSYRRFAEGYGLTARTMAWFRDHYIRTDGDIADWRASPLRVKSLAGAPPAFVAIAGYDILADEGEAYADRLEEAGVPLARFDRPGQIHGFASMGRYTPDAHAVVLAAVAAWRSYDPAFG